MMVEVKLGLQYKPENLDVNKVWTGQSSSPSFPYIQVGQEGGDRNYVNCIQFQK